MRLLTFSARTAKEILRDPLNLFFGLGFRSVYKELHADHETGAADNK